MSEFYLIAEIKSIHQQNGFVSIISHSDFPERFFGLKKVYIDIFGDKREFEVERVLKAGQSFALKFKNFDSGSDVEFLIGRKIYVDSENLAKPQDKETFFVHDLIGSQVFSDNTLLGSVTDIMSLPANDVYVITTLQGKELLIPAVKDYVESFDPEKKILVLRAGGDYYDEDEN